MTPDEIKAMSDEELRRAVAKLNRYDIKVFGGREMYLYGAMSVHRPIETLPNFSTDLNAAWPLQFQKEIVESPEWGDVLMMFNHNENGKYPPNPRRCARLISEAYYYLKTKSE